MNHNRIRKSARVLAGSIAVMLVCTLAANSASATSISITFGDGTQNGNGFGPGEVSNFWNNLNSSPWGGGGHPYGTNAAGFGPYSSSTPTNVGIVNSANTPLGTPITLQSFDAGQAAAISNNGAFGGWGQTGTGASIGLGTNAYDQQFALFQTSANTPPSNQNCTLTFANIPYAAYNVYVGGKNLYQGSVYGVGTQINGAATFMAQTNSSFQLVAQWGHPYDGLGGKISYIQFVEVPLTTAYWTGSTDNLWSVPNNFAAVQAGTPNLTGGLDAFTDVIFNANVTANFANTQLNGNQTIHSLTFGSNATTPVGIGGSDTLTITPIQPTIGVTVQTLSGDHTIGSNVALGANQTWTVTDSGQTLAVGGAVSGATKTVTKAGAGTLDLTGAVTLGAMTVSGGSASLSAASSGAITTLNVPGSGSATLAAGSTAAITTMNVTGGSASVSGSTVTTLNTSAGSTTLGTAVTTLNVSGTGAVLGAAGAAATTVAVTGGTIDTQGNYLTVADSMTMTGGNIVASGAAFGVKGSSITPNITSISELKLDGGTVTINMQGPQEVIWSESFETDGTGTRYTSNTNLPGAAAVAGTSDIGRWGRVTSIPGGIGTYYSNGSVPTEGTAMWMGEDTTASKMSGTRTTDGLESSSASWLDFTQLNVAGKTGLKLTIDLFASGNPSGSGPETVDEFKIRVKNMVSSVTTDVEHMEGQNNAPYKSKIAGSTTQLNTPGEAVSKTYDLSTLGLTGNMQLILAAGQTGGTGVEYVGFDNLKIWADANGPVNLPTTDLVATSNTTLDLGFAGAATVRDVNLGSGIALTVQTATSLSMSALTGAAGSQLLASGMGLTIASGTHTGSITASSVTKTSTGVLQLDGAQTYNTLTVEDGTLNVNGSLTTGTAAVSVTDTAGGAPTTLRFGTVSQTLSSLTIGAGATVVFTSGTATGAFGGGGKGLSVVPEPGTLGLLLLGALGVLNRRRREAGRL